MNTSISNSDLSPITGLYEQHAITKVLALIDVFTQSFYTHGVVNELVATDCTESPVNSNLLCSKHMTINSVVTPRTSFKHLNRDNYPQRLCF